MKQTKNLNSVRTAVAMGIAALLTTCLIGGTFARYTTGASSYDQARVAYWGFSETNEIDLSDLFRNSYTNVSSGDQSDVLAPGTSGQASFGFRFESGNGVTAPEVAYTFGISVEESCDASIKENDSIRFKLDDGAFGTWDQLIASLKALAGQASGTKNYAAGELPAAFLENQNTHTIYWQWAFTDDENMEEQDEVDTGMGNAATLAECSLRISVQATQID